jgi:myo-inositol-1(or 4)-monophosphatase
LPVADVAGLATAHEDLELLRDAAREAGAIAMRYFGKSPEVWMKGGTSPVSEADYAADAYLRETLLKARPGYGWLSEETADDLARLNARRTFVVDPIDGTRAFLEGNNTWCVSVAVVEQGKSLAGVLDCPAKKEVYWAIPGSGAFCNGVQIAVRPVASQPEVAGPKAFVDQLPADLLERVRRVAYVPSLAYRLAMIASGTIDASFVKPNSHDWDIAAAGLILNEAGGGLVDTEGFSPLFAREKIKHSALAAGSGELLAMLAAVIAGTKIP